MYKDDHYLEIWITAKPFTGTLRYASANVHQKNVFLSLCKGILTGFGIKWNKKKYVAEYKNKKQTYLRFKGSKKDCEKWQNLIQDEMFKVILEDKYKALREKMSFLGGKKLNVSDEEFAENAKYDKFVAGLALFNLTFMMDVTHESKIQPDN